MLRATHLIPAQDDEEDYSKRGPLLKDLKMLKKLGAGEYGQVFLVGAGTSLYALKVIDNAKIKKK